MDTRAQGHHVHILGKNDPSLHVDPSKLGWVRALKAQQADIAQRAVLQGSLESVHYFAALDISNNPRDARDKLYVAAVLFERGISEPLETVTCVCDAPLPYIPGLLAFREAPAMIEAISKLSRQPELLWVDGHGATHPRGAGIATHLGVVLGRPSLGVAKRPFSGEIQALPDEAGSSTPIVFGQTARGFALRTRRHANPIYISSGHLCSAKDALIFVFEHLDRRRLPWPTRLAHDAANHARRNNSTTNHTEFAQY